MSEASGTYNHGEGRSGREILAALAGRGCYLVPGQGRGGPLQSVTREAMLASSLAAVRDPLGKALATAIALQSLRALPEIVYLAVPALQTELCRARDRQAAQLAEGHKGAQRLARLVPRAVHALCGLARPWPRVRMRRSDYLTLYWPVQHCLDHRARRAERQAMDFFRGGGGLR